MAATTFTCFSQLPKELQIMIWGIVGTATETLEEDDQSDCETRKLGYTVNFLFISKKHSIHATPHNLSVLEDVCQRRNIMMRTSFDARQMALEMWKKEVEKASQGSKLYRCVRLNLSPYIDRRASILQHLSFRIKYRTPSDFSIHFELASTRDLQFMREHSAWREEGWFRGRWPK